MPRPRKTAQPEPAIAEAQAVVYEEHLGDTLVAPLAPTASPPEPVAAFYSVGVRNRCPWATVRSASTDWGRTPTIIRADDARLNELQRCEWLLVAPVP